MFIQNSLSKDLLKSIVIIYFIITFFVTIGHLITEYTYTKHKIQTELVGIADTFKPMLTNALWNFNHDQVTSIAEGMMHIDILYAVKIQEAEGNIIAKKIDSDHIKSTDEDQKELSYLFPITYNYKEQNIYLGEVTLQSGHCAIIERIKVGFFMLFINALIKSTALIILFTFAFNKHLGYPLKELTQRVALFSWHDKNRRRINMSFKKENELSILLDKFNTLLQKISNEEEKRIALSEKHQKELQMRVDRRTFELKNANEQLSILAQTDPLTGLYNRSKLDEALKENYVRYQRYGRVFSVILIDIDHFKHINDDFGHDVGDKTLIKVSELLRTNSRSTDIVGRWGGEEFLIICVDTDEKSAYRHAETLRKLIQTGSFEPVDKVTASFGIAQIEKDLPVHRLLKHADIALYEAKEKGRNNSIIFIG